MAGLFRLISPSWGLSGVHACTILATDSEGLPVSFSSHTELGRQCRERLELLIQPLEPITWLKQVHGRALVELPLTDEAEGYSEEDVQVELPMLQPIADACYTRQSGVVCAILTADCLPVLLTNDQGTVVSAIHAGRKGLEKNILSAVVQTLGDASQLQAWIGPGIAASSYPLSKEIRDEFVCRYPNLSYVFKSSPLGDFCMDIAEVARVQLMEAGIASERISMAVKNTFTDPELHSARRDGDASGRMATLIWMD